jgi:diacylglycerol kinase
MTQFLTFCRKRWLAFGYAFTGAWDLLRNHAPAKVHLFAFFGMVVIAWYLDFAMWKWIVFFLCSAMVLACESLNTAIEYVVDLVSPEHNELAGKAKDVAAAAVLFSSLFSAVIAGLMIWDEFYGIGV